ncbi:MAG: DUF1349 domain-containing protein [Spirochaetaceae bacterium]|nr:DUF1349 domain-containing protein [Spirochaetaceae bacterium]
MIIPFDRAVPDDFFWLNQPDFRFEQGILSFSTSGGTDFWQRTHYGFSRDDGHAMLTSLSSNFTMSVKTSFEYKTQFDQCGLLLRIDALNWIKVGTEKEDSETNRLGSVVTNLGYSDWATSDIGSSIGEIWYKVKSTENDFIISSSLDGVVWTQMRIAHLHSRQRPINAGIYACSPKEGGFSVEFSELDIETETAD